MTEIIINGLGHSQDGVLLLLRILLGSFFVLARFRYFYDPSRPDDPWLNGKRHDHLRWKMCTCGFPRWLAPFIASIEVSAGLGVTFGFLTPISALGLFCVTVGATFCTAKVKIKEQGPVDKIDFVSCYLWRVEILYISMALLLALNGGGRWSLDHLIVMVLS